MDFIPIINDLFDNHLQSQNVLEENKDTIHQVIAQLDKGAVRVCEQQHGLWIVQEWVKKAILLYFKITPSQLMEGTPFLVNQQSYWFDKIPSKFMGWTLDDFQKSGIRAVPGAFVRYGSFIEKQTVIMPSFINIGAYVGEGTMVDTWCTIGSCAQIGKRCHISGGVGIGGVLEPLQANPVIIEDDCFIGARSEIAEGVIVEKGSVISMGVFIGASTKIVNRQTGEISYGRVPAYSVVVPGTLPSADPLKPALACAVIVKQVDERTRSKTKLTDLLRAID